MERKELWGEELGSVKKKKREFESIAQRLIDIADKKAKEAEKQKNASQMKALLMESNASREKSEKLQKGTSQLRKKKYRIFRNSSRNYINRINLLYVCHFYILDVSHY